MAQPIVLPSFGMYTAEGTMVAWVEPHGAVVEQGQTIAEIETEKATHEIPAPASGVLHHVATLGSLLKEEGIMGYILERGETAPGDGSAVAAVSLSAAATPARSPASAPAATAQPLGWIKASPFARRTAREQGIDLAIARGSGPGGRIVAADIRTAMTQPDGTQPGGTQLGGMPPDRTLPDAAQPADVFPAVLKRSRLSAMRRAIAERLHRSQNTSVALTLVREVEVDRLVTARQALSATLPAPVLYDAYFAKIVATALRQRPELNAAIEGDELIAYDDIHLGIAVSLPDGLIVPVLRHVDRTPILTLAERIRDLVKRARSKALRPEELLGGTFTLTNLGGFGIDAFTPVLHAAQSGILGIGRIQPRVVARPDGTIAVVPTTTLSLTFDHRVTDGAPAAQLLDEIARYLNDEAVLALLARA